MLDPPLRCCGILGPPMLVNWKLPPPRAAFYGKCPIGLLAEMWCDEEPAFVGY